VIKYKISNDFMATKKSDQMSLQLYCKLLKPLFHCLGRLGQNDSQGAFFCTREISPVVKLDVGGKLAYGILDRKF
jgi:hypothetical protein